MREARKRNSLGHHAQTAGTEHVLLSSGRPWDLEPSHGVAGFAFTEQDKEFLLPLFENLVRTRQAGTRMISSVFQVSIAQNLTINHGKYDGHAPKHQWSLEDYTVI